MGGRGASSGFGSGVTTGTRGSGGQFYDRTGQYSGMTLHEFENAIRDKSTEYIGLFDAKGQLIVAGTSGQTGAVAVPTEHPRFGEAVILTHNHPSDGTRGIGGTFSEADVKNHAWLALQGKAALQQTRAVASGKGENTYILRNRSDASPMNLLVTARGIENTGKMAKTGKSVVTKVEDAVYKKYGRHLSDTAHNSVYLGGMKRVWKDETGKAGYDYVEVKKARW